MFSKLLNLMGSQLIKGYSIEKQPKGQAGFNGLWRLYDGTKQGTNEPVSIFIIDKKSLKKTERDEIIKQAKKEPAALAKFKHPGILSLCEPLIEDEQNLAFVVERVQGNLQHFIKNQRFSEICSSELEIRIQLLPFLQTLNFVHNTVKMAHLAINPENIYLMPDGKWKLAGFSNSQSLNTNNFIPYETKQHLDMSYLAPQMVISEKCGYVSDTFSIMLLVLNLVKTASNKKQFRPLISAASKQEYERHKEILARIDSHPYVLESTNSPALARLARDALQWQPQRRMTISQFIQSDWMNDDFILTIKHLESITSLEQKRQLEFIKGMEEVLFRFETPIVKKRIIPALIGLLKFDYLIAVVLIVLVEILKRDLLNATEFQKYLWTPIKTLTNSKEIPAHALYVLVDNIDVWAKFMSLQDLNSTIIPLYIKCFDCPNKLKELALKKVEFLSKKFDYQFTKTKILPRLLNMMGDKTYDIRKYSLIALYKIMAVFDAQTISDQILVGLDKNRKMGTDPFINAITLKLYGEFSKTLNLDIIGNKIIPSLVPYLSDPSITKNDFEMYKNTILSLINRIQQERCKNFSIAEGMFFTEADFDFAKDDKIEQKVPQQPNFDFLSSFKSQPQQPLDTSPVNKLHHQPLVNNFDFGPNSAGLTYISPINVVNNNSQQQQFRYEPPKVLETRNNGISGLDFLNTPTAPSTIDSKTPTSTVSSIKPVHSKKPVSIQQAADDFFSGLADEPKPQPNKHVFKGPVAKAAATAGLITQPPLLQTNNNFSNSPYGVPINITMNTGGTVDPFAQLESQLKRNVTESLTMPQPNYQDLQMLSGGTTNQPIKPVIKKPTQLIKPPTTNVASINNDDFFDLL